MHGLEVVRVKKMGTIDWIALILVIVGGLNWGLVGAVNFDLVKFLFGSWSIIVKVVYILVGLSALYMLANLSKIKDGQEQQ